jgi:pheromone a factor receptor
MLRSSSFARFKVTTPGTGGNPSNAALPIYVEKEVINKRDSFDTFTSADLVSLRSGSGSTITKLSSFAGPTKCDTPTSSASPSRSPSPTTRPRPRVEVTSEIYPEDSEPHTSQMSLRTPETAFPRSVTPDVETRRLPLPAESSFLEMVTPAADGFSPLARVETPRAALRRGGNWV